MKKTSYWYCIKNNQSCPLYKKAASTYYPESYLGYPCEFSKKLNIHALDNCFNEPFTDLKLRSNICMAQSLRQAYCTGKINQI